MESSEKEKHMYERVAIPIYWDSNTLSGIFVKNWKQLNDQYLSKGWEVERVDELHSNTHPLLMYILRKEKDVEE